MNTREFLRASVIGLALCGAAACTTRSESPSGVTRPLPSGPVPTGTPIVIEGGEGVVVDPQEASRFHVGAPPDDFFAPRGDELVLFEQALRAWLETHHPSLEERVDGYRRYWLGLILGGERKIWASFACQVEPDWVQQPAVVRGGGDCYFRVQWDLSSSEVEHFDANPGR